LNVEVGWNQRLARFARKLAMNALGTNTGDDFRVPDPTPRFTTVDVPPDLAARLVRVAQEAHYDGADMQPEPTESELVEIGISCCTNVQHGVTTWDELVAVDVSSWPEDQRSTARAQAELYYGFLERELYPHLARLQDNSR
jgi:hypothetical protein